ncbi:sensor histidine kinase [Conexibacter woesei]|uniref:histidine kinase n=1 Tax=Conexibacter woesei (strain DSM 14684 / CCUG 47730 / CIP 108061 / JCM 11494 / NBRC 100937 / ID131577) TaxID=469383 RepID=D3F655_CONWI|nr:ATP-binding protein [Conexibacter woesei]ADB48728.1 integral membrane sensor signal transduction histidine kinase [Conexibacter woesei DSM 14684]
MSRVPIRLRVTGAFVLVMALVLVATGVFVDRRVASERSRALDADLRSQVAGADAASVRAEDDEPVQLLAADGRVLATSEEAGARPLLDRTEVRQLLGDDDEDDDDASADDASEELRREVTLDGDAVRLFAREDGSGHVVVAGRSLDDLDDQLASLRTTLLVAGLAALALASAIAYVAVAAALRPVERMRARAAAVSEEDPAARLPIPPARDEIRRLGETLNAMLDRLHGALDRERRFVADASHELRTPLSILKAELELAARPGRTPGELRETVASAAEETDRLGRLAEDLLVLARADRGRLPVRPEPVDADALLGAVRERFAVRAAHEQRPLEVEPDAALTVSADPLRVEQALGNLVDNALRHGSGAVRLSARRSGPEAVRLAVRDDGPGLPPALAATAFERFTRGDEARGRGGAGLGLAIVAAIATAHGGRAGADGGSLWIELPDAGTAGGS